ncbi:MAG: hypothetical protein WCS94_02515 [Verrucomicrobiota bacterium]
MKTYLTTGLSALCVILLTVMLVLQAKQKTNLEALRLEHKTLASDLEHRQQKASEEVAILAGQVTNLGANMEARLTQSKQQAEAFLTSLQEQGSTNSAEMLRGIFQVSYDVRSNLTKMNADLDSDITGLKDGQTAANHKQQSLLEEQTKTFKKATDALFEQTTEWKKGIAEMRQQLDDLVNSGALFPDKTKPALEAVALAKAAEQAGDTNLAKIYYLSAVNHAPSAYPVLSNYANLVFRDTASTPEDFARLKSVLQISLYQIPPATVTNVLSLLNETTRRETELLAAQTPKAVPVNWQEQFDKIAKAVPLDTAWNDLKTLSKRWEGMNQIAESLREEPSQTNLLEQVENEAELTQNVLTASRLAQIMDTILQSLDASVEQPGKAVSQLQTAEATLGQLWGIDFNVAGWPKSLSDKVDAYPMAIQSYVEKVAAVKSRPAIAKLEKALADAKNYQIGKAKNKYQQAVVYYDGCVSNAIDAAQNISTVAGRKESEDAIKTIRDLTLDAKRKQFDAYQKWAVARCEDSFNEYDSFKTMTRDHAWQSFHAGNLKTIDQTILSPDVSRLFNDIMSKLTVQAKGTVWGMDGANVFAMQKQCAEATKKKLEDF